MARKIIKTDEIEIKKEENQQENQEVDLSVLIDDYGHYNDLKKTNEKIANELNAKIKDEFSIRNISDYDGNNYSAKLSVRQKFSFDEERLLHIVKSLPLDYRTRLIYTKELVDIELLERMIINGEISPELFVDAQVVTTTYSLISKKKKKEN